MNKKILFTILFTSLFFSACTQKQSDIEKSSTSTSMPVASPTIIPIQPKSPETQQYTMTEVSQHNSKDDCWFVIDNAVYDVTNFIPKHPGGIIIAQGCGKDASKLFHSVEKHKEKALKIMSDWKIGEL